MQFTLQLWSVNVGNIFDVNRSRGLSVESNIPKKIKKRTEDKKVQELLE